MTTFIELTLDVVHHQSVVCCKCGKNLYPRDKAVKHRGKSANRYYCSECYAKIWY